MTLDNLNSPKEVANAERENALMGQKARIIEAINAASDSHELRAAFDLLVFASELWHAVGYGYKVRELTQRVRDRAALLIAEERLYLALARKNDKHRASTVANIERLVILENC